MSNPLHALFDRLAAMNWNLPLIPISAEERRAAKGPWVAKEEPPVFDETGTVTWDARQ